MQSLAGKYQELYYRSRSHSALLPQRLSREITFLVLKRKTSEIDFAPNRLSFNRFFNAVKYKMLDQSTAYYLEV